MGSHRIVETPPGVEIGLHDERHKAPVEFFDGHTTWRGRTRHRSATPVLRLLVSHGSAPEALGARWQGARMALWARGYSPSRELAISSRRAPRGVRDRVGL